MKIMKSSFSSHFGSLSGKDHVICSPRAVFFFFFFYPQTFCSALLPALSNLEAPEEVCLATLVEVLFLEISVLTSYQSDVAQGSQDRSLK